MDNLEKLLTLGAENCHPKLIAKVGGQNEFVGEFVDGELRLTDHGRELLKLPVADVEEEEKPAKRTRAKVEQKAPETDDIDLG